MYVCCCVRIPYPITWEPFLETEIFVCASGMPDSIKILKVWASISHHQAPNKETATNGYRDMGLEGHMDTQTHGCTDTHKTNYRIPPSDQYQW